MPSWSRFRRTGRRSVETSVPLHGSEGPGQGHSGRFRIRRRLSDSSLRFGCLQAIALFGDRAKDAVPALAGGTMREAPAEALTPHALDLWRVG